MTDFATLLNQGTASAWLFIPSAILLGALHGLEPGHSKTMMAAFIIAIRGTVRQAVILGLAATLSHTAVVWLIAMGGLFISHKVSADTAEPWFQLLSGVVIMLTAGWMFWRTWSEEHQWQSGQRQIAARVSNSVQGHPAPRQPLVFYKIEHQLEAGHKAGHQHHHAELIGLEEGSQEYQDAHQRAHAADIRQRFADRRVTNGQIVLFGLTGGLIPCPAAITVLLLCIQVKKFSLGAALVVCFSIGLALTLLIVGSAAALSVRHVTQRWSGFATLARRAPYFSSLLIAIVGLYMAYHGLQGIN
ncbi:nickel/cobalt exporter [Erwinia toletana]|uniref:Nickel/cobalt efflux system n=1 Tax=Winslowiella toletana TaxID=92490 RepID=A0ABS4PA04_9GAMM|nr:nickel/cobalt efflux protein RcnA [Winslowiella toletana]MBP2169443.1 nickel/cobalt exporter [Winslowiella toletana]